MTVDIDFESLFATLREHETQVLPFVVRVAEPLTVSVDFVRSVKAAIDRANEAAVSRTPGDPTWCTEGDLAGHEVLVVMMKGSFSDADVRGWFLDFSRALMTRSFDAIVTNEAKQSRAPKLDDWIEMPPAVTAFLSFTADVDGRRRTLPENVVEQTADRLVAWSALPGAALVIRRGLTSFVVSERAAAANVRLSARLDPSHGLKQVIASPRQARSVSFTYEAKGTLQVVDESRAPASTLFDLLEPLEVLAPYLDYAWVRRAQPTVPNEGDVELVLGRVRTPGELAASRRPHLLAHYVVDAHVAQVLTSSHLARAGNLVSYAVDQVAADRYLAVARDAEPWLASLNPDEHVLERGREEFGEALIRE